MAKLLKQCRLARVTYIIGFTISEETPMSEGQIRSEIFIPIIRYLKQLFLAKIMTEASVLHIANRIRNATIRQKRPIASERANPRMA